MNYKIYVKSSEPLKICCGDFSNFEDAQAQMRKMISSLFDSIEEFAPVSWKDFKEDLPKEISLILECYEKGTFPSYQKEMRGKTDVCSYFVDEEILEISEIDEEAIFTPVFKITTNTIGIDGSNKHYYFRFWTKGFFSNEVLEIGMKKEN